MINDVKFSRKYTLLIETFDNQIIEVKLPFTLEFNCQRHNLASVNKANLKIYNLNKINRNLIYKDKYTTLIYRRVELKAGYDIDSPVIFRGNILQAFSYKQGVNIITEIDAFDGGYAIRNSVSSLTINKGEIKRDTLSRLTKDLKNINGSIIGNFPSISKRGKVLFGNTFQFLRSESNNNVFIDNEKVNILTRNEVIEGDISIIDSDFGLLESPIRSETELSFKILFEPRLKVGQGIELKSIVNSFFNGKYKVIGFQHVGVISDAVGGQCHTIVNLWLGTKAFNLVGA